MFQHHNEDEAKSNNERDTFRSIVNDKYGLVFNANHSCIGRAGNANTFYGATGIDYNAEESVIWEIKVRHLGSSAEHIAVGIDDHETVRGCRYTQVPWYLRENVTLEHREDMIIQQPSNHYALQFDGQKFNPYGAASSIGIGVKEGDTVLVIMDLYEKALYFAVNSGPWSLAFVINPSKNKYRLAVFPYTAELTITSFARKGRKEIEQQRLESV